MRAVIQTPSEWKLFKQDTLEFCSRVYFATERINMKIKTLIALLLASIMLCGCALRLPTDFESNSTSESSQDEMAPPSSDGSSSQTQTETQGSGKAPSPSQDESTFEAESDSSYGESLEDLGAYDGVFEGETTIDDLKIEYISGSKDIYTYENNVLTFGEISEDSVYLISGRLNGAIVIDIVNDYKLELELSNLTVTSSSANPITVLSGDEVKIQAKKDTSSYIYDNRAKIDEADETQYSGAIHSLVDLEIGGKGALTVVSENNNGIRSKDNLQVKNLSLLVSCADNALKGNDGVEITEASLTLVAKSGDGIKTTSSDVSSNQNQRGSVTISNSKCNIYSACDGIDASYDVIIGEDSVVNIYTDKYSSYSGEVTEDSIEKQVYYVRNSSNAYKYSIKYYNSDSDYEWVNAQYHSSANGGRSTYYYYSFPKKSEYSKLQLFVYSSSMEQGQDDEFYASSDYLTLNSSYDTLALSSRWGGTSISWTTYSSSPSMGGLGGMGGMQEGNSDKGEYSTKGIKASNQITVNGGTISVKSYDDALHARNDVTLENGQGALGNITINGGSIALYSNDDGLHADGTLTINGGSVSVTNSYEGAEGNNILINGGSLSILAKDDGMNATASSGTAITVKGGYLYIYCSGDGIDANSRASYAGISFEGGKTVVISTSGGNSAIDTEAGYAYTGGYVLAIMPQGGMSSEAIHTSGFSSIGVTKKLSLSEGQYLSSVIAGNKITLKMPVSLNAYIIVLGDSSASVSASAQADATLNNDGVAWE